jgi:hypothetical protein
MAVQKIKAKRRHHNTWNQDKLQSHGNKTAWYWHNNRLIDQWNRMEDPETYPCIFSQLILDKSAQNTHYRKERTVSSTNSAGELDSLMQKIET